MNFPLWGLVCLVQMAEPINGRNDLTLPLNTDCN